MSSGQCLSGEVLDTIIKIIKTSGPIPFDRYMQLALYHRRGGYYRKKLRIGEDYITAPEISPVFGRLIGRFVCGSARQIKGEGPLVVLELGSGSGRMADEAVAVTDLSSETAAGKVIWVGSDVSYVKSNPIFKGRYFPVAADGLSSFRKLKRAVILANEFFDAQPCSIVEYRSGKFVEIVIDAKEGKLIEARTDITSPLIMEYIKSRGLPQIEGARYEISLSGREIIRQSARIIESGILVVIDYGGTADEMTARAALGGTVRAFRSHSVMHHPLSRPGSADITADVNFSDLAAWGEESGFNAVYQKTQQEFMMDLGLMNEMALLSQGIDDRRKLTRYLAAKRFLVPGGIQKGYRVLVLAKGLERYQVKDDNGGVLYG